MNSSPTYVSFPTTQVTVGPPCQQDTPKGPASQEDQEVYRLASLAVLTHVVGQGYDSGLGVRTVPGL
jgi:hypothetical protein